MQRLQKFLKVAGPIVLILYFLIGLMAYTSVWPGSIQLFRSNSVAGLGFRAFTTFLLLVYSILCFWVNRYKSGFPWRWLVFFSLVLIANGFVSFLSERTEHYFYKNIYGILFEATSTVGYRQILMMYLSTISDFALAFCFLFLMPRSVRKNTLVPLVVLILLFMAFECGYCAVFERDKILTVLTRSSDPYSGYDISIGATFGDKQEFGAFLAIGVCCALALPWLLRLERKWLKRTVSIACAFLCVLFIVFSFLSLCKTAMLASLLSILFFGLFCLVGITKRNKKTGVICWSIAGIIGLAVVLFLSIPAFHSSGVLKTIYDYVDRYFFSRINGGIFSRFYLIEEYFSGMTFWNFLFGLGKALQGNYMSAVSGDSPGLHTGFVYFQACYGLFGSILYACAFLLVLRRIVLAAKQNIYLAGVMVGVLICSLVFNLAECTILIFSGSIGAYIFNLICVVLPGGVLSDEKE